MRTWSLSCSDPESLSRCPSAEGNCLCETCPVCFCALELHREEFLCSVSTHTSLGIALPFTEWDLNQQRDPRAALKTSECCEHSEPGAGSSVGLGQGVRLSCCGGFLLLSPR